MEELGVKQEPAFWRTGLRGGVALVGGCGRDEGYDPAERFDAEKTETAGIAAVRGKTKPPLHGDESAGFDAFAGDVFEVEVAAARTVRVHGIRGGHLPTTEALLATETAPRTQTGQTGGKIKHAAAVRPVTFNASAPRTDHRAPSKLLSKFCSISKTRDAGKLTRNAPRCRLVSLPKHPPR
jgi:hypothetical protein